MFEVGRLCVKTAGRDANRKCVIVNVIDIKYVMIDGETRRRKCNVAHLEPLNQVIKISKDASHETVKKEFNKLGLKVRETKPKGKTEKPKKVRKKKEVAVEGKGSKEGEKEVKKIDDKKVVKKKPVKTEPKNKAEKKAK